MTVEMKCVRIWTMWDSASATCMLLALARRRLNCLNRENS